MFSALVVLACGGGDGDDVAPTPPAPMRVATLGDLVGAWQPEPFLLDAVWRNSILTACRRDIQTPGGAAAVIDARGAGVATVRLTGQVAAKCDALRITPAGQIEGAGGGGGGGEDDEAAPPVSIFRIEEGFVLGGSLTVTGWSVTGRAGEGVARVEVMTEAYPRITASFENGWFSAWWPASRGDRRPGEGLMAAYRVRAFDKTGALLDERESSRAMP